MSTLAIEGERFIRLRHLFPNKNAACRFIAHLPPEPYFLELLPLLAQHPSQDLVWRLHALESHIEQHHKMTWNSVGLASIDAARALVAAPITDEERVALIRRFLVDAGS